MCHSVTTQQGEGFEAFVTTSGALVVAVVIKKKVHSISVGGGAHLLGDGQWHCLDVCHACARGPFRKSQVNVYIDGRRVMMSDLDFPTNKDVSRCVVCLRLLQFIRARIAQCTCTVHVPVHVDVRTCTCWHHVLYDTKVCMKAAHNRLVALVCVTRSTHTASSARRVRTRSSST